MKRHHRPDEEPDVDEAEWDVWREREVTRGHCERCGIFGHAGDKCPTVTPLLLRQTP